MAADPAIVDVQPGNRIAYVDPFSGVAGDMLLAAFIHAGYPLDRLRATLALVGAPASAVDTRQQRDSLPPGLRLWVDADERGPQLDGRLASVLAHVDGSSLEARVKARALSVLTTLGEAEAAVHGCALEDVRLHENMDPLVDIVGVADALEHLRIDGLWCGALPLGGPGMIQSSHGPLPVPAPATLEMARRSHFPTRPVETDRELVTPTGAALITALARPGQPAMCIQHVGCGYGHARLPWPNMLRVWIGEAPPTVSPPRGANAAPGVLQRDMVDVLETNLDNTTGELLGALLDELLALGALDVSHAPIAMKKSRPAVALTVIVPAGQGERFARVLLERTGTLGVRARRGERFVAERREASVLTPLGPCRLKVKVIDGREVDRLPEMADVVELARRHGRDAWSVYHMVRREAARMAQLPADAEARS